MKKKLSCSHGTKSSYFKIYGLENYSPIRPLHQSKRQANNNNNNNKLLLSPFSSQTRERSLGARILTIDYSWKKQKRETEREKQKEREHFLPLFQSPLTQYLTTVDHFPQNPTREFITSKNQITLENVLIK